MPSNVLDQSIQFLETAGKINQIIHQSPAEHFGPWIQYFNEKGFAVDINRILRLAILRLCFDAVQYLIDHQGASLEQVDIFNRSAIFYAVQLGNLNMLRYVADMLGPDSFQQGQKHYDIHKKTSWYYLVILDSPPVAVIDFLLANDSVPDEAALEAW